MPSPSEPLRGMTEQEAQEREAKAAFNDQLADAIRGEIAAIVRRREEEFATVLAAALATARAEGAEAMRERWMQSVAGDPIALEVVAALDPARIVAAHHEGDANGR